MCLFTKQKNYQKSEGRTFTYLGDPGIYIYTYSYIFFPSVFFFLLPLDLNLTTFFYTQTPGLLSPRPPPWDAFQQVFVGDLLYIALIFSANDDRQVQVSRSFSARKDLAPTKIPPKWSFCFPSCPFWIPYVLLKICPWRFPPANQKLPFLCDPSCNHQLPIINAHQKWWFLKWN